MRLKQVCGLCWAYKGIIVRILSLIKNILEKEERFLITSHIRPDGDSIGTQLALGIMLHGMGKKVTILNEDTVPKCYSFLPHSDWIKSSLNNGNQFDAAIILDCSEWERLGKIAPIAQTADVIINIDHHADSHGLGKYNYIDPSAAAVAEQAYHLFKHMKQPLTYELALCLYTGILTDTGSFKHGNTTVASHHIVSEFLKMGVKPDFVYRNIHERNSFPAMLLQGMLLSSLQLSNDGHVAWTSITKEMLKKVGYSVEFEPESVLSMMRSIEGIDVALLFRDLGEDKIKVNFRSRSGVDVWQIAQRFDGGGHKQAAGCVITGNLEMVQEMVLQNIMETLNYC
ncbi:MAG: bifunctional oligoribonuclease/PAP phosphatase NrnA [Candidatus Desantisbacteria bacterium]